MQSLGRVHFAPRGGAPNKDTPDPPLRKNDLALGGSDPPPRKNDLALGGSDRPPPSTNEGAWWKIFSAPSARLNTATTFHQNITSALKVEVNFGDWWRGLGFAPQARRKIWVWVASE